MSNHNSISLCFDPHNNNPNDNSFFSFNSDSIKCLCIEHSNNSFSGFSVIHQNIRSLRKNVDSFYSHLASLNHLPDLIFLSEIWIYNFEVSDFSIPNYTFTATCNDSYSSGGIAVFHRSDLACEIINSNLASADVISVKCEISGARFCFIGIYRLHMCSIKVFLDEFCELLENQTCKNLVLLGDFNINILSISPDADLFLSTLSSFGFDSLLSQPTRVVTNSSTCLDHIFIRLHRNNCLTYKSAIYDLKITDHCLTSIQLSSGVSRSKQVNVKDFTKIDFVALRRALTFEFWDETYGVDDPSIAFDLFLSKLHSHISNCSKIIKKKKQPIKLYQAMDEFCVT